MIITRIKVIVSPCGMYEEKSKSNGGTNMSILLEAPVKRMGIITKSIPGEPKTSLILLISAAIVMAVVLLMYVGILYTEGTMKAYSDCRDKIIGFEQNSVYSSSEQFKLALSYCDGK
jgi:hypothetical protein